VVSSSLPHTETHYQAIQPKLVFGQPELTTSRKMALWYGRRTEYLYLSAINLFNGRRKRMSRFKTRDRLCHNEPVE